MKEKNRIRRWLYVAAAVAALLASGPMLPVELAIWFSGELLLYLEVVSGVWLASRAGGWNAWRAWLSGKVQRVRHRIAVEWLSGKVQRVRHRIAVEWPRAHPSAASWLQWTFASV